MFDFSFTDSIFDLHWFGAPFIHKISKSMLVYIRTLIKKTKKNILRDHWSCWSCIHRFGIFLYIFLFLKPKCLHNRSHVCINSLAVSRIKRHTIIRFICPIWNRMKERKIYDMSHHNLNRGLKFRVMILFVFMQIF